MDKQIFFNASLPRAGSTILQNIIAQNPNFHVTPTSGVAELIRGLGFSFAYNNDFKNQTDLKLCEKNFYNFCKEGISGYYSNINKPYILDKNREWLSQIHILNQLYTTPKVICLIRDLRSILTSYEKQYQNHLTHKYLPNSPNVDYYNSTISERINEYSESSTFKVTLKHIFNIFQFKNKNNIKLINLKIYVIHPNKPLMRFMII